MSGNVVVLAGGTGGAKFVRGVARCVPPEQLTIIVNTGDDVSMHGLRISPDIDIIMYTLAGLVDPHKGWGFAGDTFNCIEQLRQYGRAGWFNLGDRDLATHMQRSLLLRENKPPSQVAAAIARGLGVRQRLLPMTDQQVETHVQLSDGSLLHFQEYLVREHAPEDVQSVIFQNIGTALPAAGVLDAIAEADVVLIAPSSPVVSIGTILSVSGIFDALKEAKARGAAVSPLLAGAPISGPSAALMKAFDIDVSNSGLCDVYGAIVELLVIHEADAVDVPQIEERGLNALAIDTMMPDIENSTRVARAVLEALDYAVADVEMPEPIPFTPVIPGADAHTEVADAEGAQHEAPLRERIADLERELAEVRDSPESDEAQVAWAEHDTLLQRADALEEDVSHARKDARAFQKKADAAAAARTKSEAAAKKNAKHLKKEIAELKRAAVAAVEGQEAAASEREAGLRKRKAEAAAERDKFERRAEELNYELRELSTECTAAQEAATAAEASRKDAQQLADDLREEVASHTGSHEAQVAELTAELERQREAVAAAQSQMREVEGALGDATVQGEDAAEARQRLEDLERLAWSVTAERDDARQKLEALEAEAADAAQLAADNAAGAARIAELDAELTAVRDRAEREETAQRERADSLLQEIQDVKASRRRARERRKADREKAKAIMTRMRDQLIRLRGSMDQEETETTALGDKLAQVERVRDQQRAKLAQLESHVRMTHAELEAANATVAASEARVTKLQQELSRLVARGDAEPGPVAVQVIPPIVQPVTIEPMEVTLPPEGVGWTPGADEQPSSMAERARLWGRAPE